MDATEPWGEPGVNPTAANCRRYHGLVAEILDQTPHSIESSPEYTIALLNGSREIAGGYFRQIDLRDDLFDHVS